MVVRDRRSFVASALASLGVAAVAGSKNLWAGLAQSGSNGNPRRIDVHHHFAPPAWVAEVKGRPLLNPANTKWTPEKSIEDMDRGGVAAAIISITNPGLWFGDVEATRHLARECNEYAAKMMHDYPGRFGLFAAMPMPDVDNTLKEIEYAFDTLKADGIGLFTSYNTVWLGNEKFIPVMEELNRRKAVVHVHPTAANCCRNLLPDVSPGIAEYGFDTTRAILGVTFSGDAARFPNIRFIWSHAGGTLPFLAGRIEGAANRLKDRQTRLPHGIDYEFKRFHYDTAGAANPGAMVSLMKLVNISQVLFGTDFPPGSTSLAMAESLARCGFSKSDLRAINRENAVRLLPRFNT